MKLPSPIPRRHSRIEIIPLIDIMFFLLAAFMMVSLQLDKAQNIHVELPAAAQARPDFKPDMINLAVDKTGAVWLEKKEITLPQLYLTLSNRFRLDTNLPRLYQRRRRHPARLHRRCPRRGPPRRRPENRLHGRWRDQPMKIRSPIYPPSFRIEIIPLIDIMFFLLASFMMVSLEMPKSPHPQSQSAHRHSHHLAIQARHGQTPCGSRWPSPR